MRAKCIRLFTLNIHVFYFLLLCIQKGLTITANHGKGMHHTPFRHERHYKSSEFQRNQHSYIAASGISEAVHAFHPTNNLLLHHSQQHSVHYTRSRTTTTTTRKPLTTRLIRHNNFNTNPLKPFATSNNHQFSFKSQNHSHKPLFRHTTLMPMSPATIAPVKVHRNSFTHDDHVRKSNKVENTFFTTSEYGTTAAPKSNVLSKSSASIHTITKNVKQIQPGLRPVYRGSEEQDDYFNEFNEKNYGSDTFRAKNYREIIADGNRGKEMNLKNVINDDDNENAEDDDDEDDEEYYEYLNDEGTQEESSQIGSLTKEKWENLGTREAVDKSRSQIAHRSRQQMAADNATAHAARIFVEALCKLPRPKIIPIVHASKNYVPHCTVLHRCGDDTGCCHTDTLTCKPKRTAIVDLYFYVSTMGNRESTVEYLTFINHTECHCISRHSPMHHNHDTNHQQFNYSTTTTTTNSTIALDNFSRSRNNCQCVRNFKVFYERAEASDGDQRCRCDCDSENDTCDWLKQGKDEFPIEDRRCIVERRCLRPVCEYGQYSIQNGRCPKLEDKLAGAKRLFFD